MNRFDNIVLNEIAIEHLFENQLKNWDLAKGNYKELKNVRVREMDLSNDGLSSVKIKIQNNPARIQSSTAKVDAETIKGRKCFFCKENRPPEQLAIKYKGITTDYFVQVNPYPIFDRHLVIQSVNHCRQEIDATRLEDMLSMSRLIQHYVLFYNGPNAGASVPDHFHFQAGLKGVLPIEHNWDDFRKRLILKRGASSNQKLSSNNFLKLYVLENYTNGAFLIESSSKRAVIEKMGKIYSVLSRVTKRGNGRFEPDVIARAEKDFYEGGMWEPMMNILCWWVPSPTDYSEGFWRVVLFARGALRAKCFEREGDDRIVIQPACVEMGGLFIAPIEKDFLKTTPDDIREILSDVSITKDLELEILNMLRTQPTITVGIMHSSSIDFVFNDEYILTHKEGAKLTRPQIYKGTHTIFYNSETKKLVFDGEQYSELLFAPSPKSQDKSFWLNNVVIGVKFHWERKENQKFAGSLKFIVEDDSVCAVNIVGVEDYLTSVISSEMSATASEELLKAHAVISRSWLLAQIAKTERISNSSSSIVTNDEFIKWYDRDDHKNFDVCADDHCQRYQGLTRASTPTVIKAIDATWGEVLSYDNEICDARFYKCCGGILEKFESAWENRHYDYLIPVRDNIESVESEINKNRYGEDATMILDLTKEENAQAWILSSPESLCNTTDNKVLSQVLNNYDQETADFYRWKVVYSQEEISNLINSKSGFDFGKIVDLIPIERGSSGRLIKLKIVGTNKTMIIGKELEIRRILSASHLYSSAFVVRRYDSNSNLLPIDAYLSPDKYANNLDSCEIPDKFELLGAGWGHGVGLCQIGAAVMGEKGYKYDVILHHYYPYAQIAKKY